MSAVLEEPVHRKEHHERRNINPNINDDALANPALSKQTVTNDAVGGETVIDNGHYAGPTGSEAEEADPQFATNDLEGEDIDLRESDGS